MNRRSDHALRQTITNIEGLMLNPGSPDLVLRRCTNELMALLGANFAWAYGMRNEQSWALVACLSPDVSAVSEVLSSSMPVPEELRARLRPGRCYLISGAPQPPHPMPASHPNIEQTLCVPVADARHLYGVIYLSNPHIGFDETIEQRLRPLIAAVCCLLRLCNHMEQDDAPSRKEDATVLLPMLDALFNGVVLLDDNEKILLCNNAAARLFGLPRRDIIGESLIRFMRRSAEIIDFSEKSDENRESVWRGVAVHAAGGNKRLVDINAFEFPAFGRMRRGLVFEDISEHMRSAADYQATLQRLHALTTLAPVGMLQLNSNWECFYANNTWCDYVQMTSDELMGLGWMNGLYHADVDRFLDDLRRSTAESGQYDDEVRFQTPLGQINWARVSACALYTENGDIDGLIVTFNDITEHLNNEKRLRLVAETDQLTGLSNRSYFNDRLNSALESIERYGSVALMFIDLDNFKHINDTLGHDAGDTLLSAVALRLRDTLRKVDTISRIGGDEFTVIITHIRNITSVKMVAEKLLAALGEPFHLAGRSIYVTCSIGISVCSERVSKEILLKQADIALYKSKESGRNQYWFFTPELNKDAGLLISLRQSLKERISEDFRLVYQPQVDARTGKITGLEALARWTHPEEGPVGPDIFIKLIEQSGLMNDFSHWLFREVFSQAKQWQPQLKKGVKVAINLSAKQFRGSDLVFNISSLCKEYGLQPGYFELEVTETALIADSELASATLESLSKIGFGIALDDFGTGYSSLMYLRMMPLNCVKIDRSFTVDVIDDDEDAKIVSGILSLAAALELSVVAEGVENDTVRDWLTERGCFTQQGYYFYRPLEAQQVTDLLAELR